MDATGPLFIVLAIGIHLSCLLRAGWWYVTSGPKKDEKILYTGLLCLMGGVLYLFAVAQAVIVGYENPDLRTGAISFISIGLRFYVVLTTLAGILWGAGLYRRR